MKPLLVLALVAACGVCLGVAFMGEDRRSAFLDGVRGDLFAFTDKATSHPFLAPASAPLAYVDDEYYAAPWYAEGYYEPFYFYGDVPKDLLVYPNYAEPAYIDPYYFYGESDGSVSIEEAEDDYVTGYLDGNTVSIGTTLFVEPFYAESAYGYEFEQPYYGDVIEYEYEPAYISYEYVYEEPWYEEAFPGFGSVITPILPPMFRPQSVSQPVVQRAPIRAPQPTCELRARPESVQVGGSVLLSWQSRNAERAVLQDTGEVPQNGSRTLMNQRVGRTYSLTVYGQGGSNTCYTVVYVR